MNHSVSLPARLSAGDTLDSCFVLAEFPVADGWDLAFFLVSRTRQIRLCAIPDCDSHRLLVDSMTSSMWAPDRYVWQACVERIGDRHTVASGRIEILPNLATSFGGADLRSHARRTLEAIEATIEGRASSDILSYQIAGRELRKIPLTELLTLRDHYRRDVRAEEAAEAAAAGRLPKNKIFTRL